MHIYIYTYTHTYIFHNAFFIVHLLGSSEWPAYNISQHQREKTPQGTSKSFRVCYYYYLSRRTSFKNVPYLVVLFKDNSLFLLLEH